MKFLLNKWRFFLKEPMWEDWHKAYFGGVDCTPESYYNFQESVERTHAEIAKGTKVIYEAAFQFNGVLAALDILVLEDDGWHAYEVKSSTKVSETYEMDATIQYYAITNSGIDLKDISIVHINNQYTKNGPLDIQELFTIESVYEKGAEAHCWDSKPSRSI